MKKAEQSNKLCSFHNRNWRMSYVCSLPFSAHALTCEYRSTWSVINGIKKVRVHGGE